jgi:hypothetical protein
MSVNHAQGVTKLSIVDGDLRLEIPYLEFETPESKKAYSATLHCGKRHGICCRYGVSSRS